MRRGNKKGKQVSVPMPLLGCSHAVCPAVDLGTFFSPSCFCYSRALSLSVYVCVSLSPEMQGQGCSGWTAIWVGSEGRGWGGGANRRQLSKARTCCACCIQMAATDSTACVSRRAQRLFSPCLDSLHLVEQEGRAEV